MIAPEETGCAAAEVVHQDAPYALAAIDELVRCGDVPDHLAAKVLNDLTIDPEKTYPATA